MVKMGSFMSCIFSTIPKRGKKERMSLVCTFWDPVLVANIISVYLVQDFFSVAVNSIPNAEYMLIYV